MTASSQFKALLAGVAAVAFVGTAFAQGTPPTPTEKGDPATKAGQRSTQNTPMGATGTPAGGGASSTGASSPGSSMGASGSGGSSSSSSSATSPSTSGSAGSSTGSGSTMGASSSGSDTSSAAGSRAARADRN